ncbi:MAG TPA: PD-(D/E)XK nuclease family protein, partial [Thermoplasmatales archaeon]|nr:PD-(D/E)XK nuclease family protein [Thermoplasmatales archaeon]
MLNICTIDSSAGMTVYSYSKLNCFLQCPRKFKLTYIDKVKTEIKETIEAFTGSRVHEVLRKLYKDLQYEKLNTLDDLIEYLKEQWYKKWDEGILITKREYTEENYLKMAERFIRDYYNRYYPFDQSRTIALEKKITVDLDSSKQYVIQGYIDRLAYREDGVYEIHDYKTGMNLPINEYLKEDKQLALYAIGVKDKYPDARDVRLIWHFLAFDKEVEISKTDEELEELKRETISLIDKIESCDEFPARISVLCDWCEYKPICGEWKHRIKLESKTLDDFSSDRGVKLVDKYTELIEKKEKILLELDREIERIRRELIDFAKGEGLDAVFGTRSKIRIISRERHAFPSKNDPRREELRKLIK